MESSVYWIYCNKVWLSPTEVFSDCILMYTLYFYSFLSTVWQLNHNWASKKLFFLIKYLTCFSEKDWHQQISMTIIPLFPLSHAFSPSLCVLPPLPSGYPKPLLLISVQFSKSISDQPVQSSGKFCFLQVWKYTPWSQPLCIFNSSMVKKKKKINVASRLSPILLKSGIHINTCPLTLIYPFMTEHVHNP